jgi:hypothetical protein
MLDAVRADRLEPPAVPDGTHDINLWLPDERCIAVEVTRVLRDRELAQIHAESGWLTRRLKLDWLVRLRDEFVVVGGRRELVDRELSIIEAGLDSFPVGPFQGNVEIFYVDPIPEKLSAFGVVEIGYAACFGSSAHVLFRYLPSGAAPMEDAFDEIEHALAKNSAKLQRADADERHLFVWIVSPHPTLGTWLFNEHLPTRRLRLPPAIDAVWVAPTNYGDRAVVFTDRAWTFRNSDGWTYQNKWEELFHVLDG